MELQQVDLTLLLTHAKKNKKKKKREKKIPKQQPRYSAPSKLPPLSPSPALSIVLKKYNNFFFSFASCNIFLVLFFNRIMNFMGLSTGLTAYEELPKNTLRLFCSLPHVSERSQNNNRAIKMTFTHSLIIIYLFFPFCAVMRAIYFMPH